MACRRSGVQLPSAPPVLIPVAICELHFKSGGALGHMTSALALVPERGTGPFPVWYLLHGLSDDHTAWLRWTSLERYLGDLPLIVVMPDGGRGFYTDSRADKNAAHETQIVKDLIGFVDGRFRTVASRRGRVVSGLSMGGYGALKFALKYPSLFRAAASHSGALLRGSGTLGETGEWKLEMDRIFGPKPAGGPDDLLALAKRCARAARPALWIDCGAEDFLLNDNRTFHTHLEKLGYPHVYTEYPGAHTWEYWDEHVRDVLAFFTRTLGLTTPA